MEKRRLISVITLSIIICMIVLASCNTDLHNGESGENEKESTKVVSIGDIPDYSGSPYTKIYGNVPNFDEKYYTEDSFEKYSSLDYLGRCGVAFANIGKDLMPQEKRGSIGQVKPSGWQISKYDNVDGKYLYNRCHLIGFQLTGENANERNLITGTRYMNVDGMLPFENMVADYVKETGNHVLYRVTPIFTGDNLVADGVMMEASSVEDRGESISFSVFVYNVQPGVVIDYKDGSNRISDKKESANNGKADEDQSLMEDVEIRGNKRSKIYHCPGQRDYDLMAESDNLIIFNSEQEAIDAGYRKARN